MLRSAATAMAALAATAFAPAAATASGGDMEVGPSATNDPDVWRFRAAAYGWLIGVTGTAKARGQAVDVDARLPSARPEERYAGRADGLFVLG